MVCRRAAAAAYAAARRFPLAIAVVPVHRGDRVRSGMWDARDGHAEPGDRRRGRCRSPIAIPLGIWSARSDRVQRALRPILDAMQTMPQFVYLVPVIALFHVGRVPGVIAALVYALPPCIRLTDLGIRQVPARPGRGGASRSVRRHNQLLRKVQLPLAQPVDPAGREPDDHDGALGRHHRRADRRRRTRLQVLQGLTSTTPARGWSPGLASCCSRS